MPCPCQLCSSTHGTIHLTRLDAAGARTELHLCKACAARIEFSPDHPPEVEVALATPSSSSSASGEQPIQTVEVPAAGACPNCGLEFSAYVQSNLFGCPDCYQAFAPQVTELAKAYHGAITHAGRLPVAESPSGSNRRAQQAAARHALELALKEAVEREQFERAAELRDQLRQLKPRTPKSPPAPDSASAERKP